MVLDSCGWYFHDEKRDRTDGMCLTSAADLAEIAGRVLVPLVFAKVVGTWGLREIGYLLPKW